MDSIYKDPTDIPQPDELQQLQAKIMQKHSMLLFQFCTLLSAYLLVRHVEKLLQNTTFENNEARLEKIKSDCLALYVVRYDHIIATYKDEEDQNQEDEDEQNENSEETEHNELTEEAEQNELPEENEQNEKETKQNNKEAEQNDEEIEQQDEETELRNVKTEQQDEEVEQQDEETEQQDKDSTKTTDANDISNEDYQESNPECSLSEEPAAKKQKTDP